FGSRKVVDEVGGEGERAIEVRRAAVPMNVVRGGHGLVGVEIARGGYRIVIDGFAPGEFALHAKALENRRLKSRVQAVVDRIERSRVDADRRKCGVYQRGVGRKVKLPVGENLRLRRVEVIDQSLQMDAARTCVANLPDDVPR